jgi:ABC-2 type transport system ATP-binding protein
MLVKGGENMETVIQIKEVSKMFRDLKAVDRVNLMIDRGETVAILGPNGAGKTTLISIMLGILNPTSGEVQLFGKKPNQVRNRIGVMLQHSIIPDDVKVKELIDLFRSYYPHPFSHQELLQMVLLENQANTMAQKLSGGQKRRLAFALAMAGNPDLIFLDEPTVGMDVTSRKLFWEKIQSMKRSGKTILFTTHYLEEAEAVADRIVVIHKGKKVSEGPLTYIQQTFMKKAVIFTWKQEEVAMFSDFPYVENVMKDGDRVTLYTNDSDALLRELFLRDLPISDVFVDKGSLNDLFDDLTKGEMVDERALDAVQSGVSENVS